VSVVVDIAEAVKEALNGHSFSQPFTATRQYRPAFELKDMTDLHVTVVPHAVEVTSLSRSMQQYDVQVHVAVQKKFTEDSPAELDPLMDLVEEVMDFFRLRKLGNTGATCMGVANAPVYAAEHMAELRQFTSLVTLTFRVMR